MVVIGVVGEGVDANTSAGHKDTGHFKVAWVHETDEILHDDVDAVLVEVAVVAEGEQVQFERFALDHSLARDITDVDVSEVRLSGLGAKGGELGTVEGHEILIFRMFVREGLKHARIVIVAVLYVLIAKQGDALQLFFCSHVVFSFFSYREWKNSSTLQKSVQNYNKNCTYANF